MQNGTYSVTVIRDFIAQHYLIGGDWGPENQKHSHHFTVELTLSGTSLDRHNYMVDIVEIEERLDGFVSRYRDQTLNDTPAFADTNPSIELFARVAWEDIVPALSASTVSEATVTMWEHDQAKASYTAPVS
ncbi:MAG: 6-carboxytetrahydropterin synthase [Alkalispirochaeta sp.]